MAERIEMPAWIAQKNRNKAEQRPGLVWKRARTEDGIHLEDSWLQGKDVDILVTYETISRRRVAKLVQCRYGTVTNKLPGRVVAWMPTPEPFRE